MFKSVVLIGCGLVAFVCVNVNGMSDADRSKLMDAIAPYLHECGEKFGISPDEIKNRPMNDNSRMDPCFEACVLKKIGFFNQQGMFDKETTVERVTKEMTNPDDIAKATKVAEKCASVNSESVSDGDKGCERAKLLIDCLDESKKEFGL